MSLKSLRKVDQELQGGYMNIFLSPGSRFQLGKVREIKKKIKDSRKKLISLEASLNFQ